MEYNSTTAATGKPILRVGPYPNLRVSRKVRQEGFPRGAQEDGAAGSVPPHHMSSIDPWALPFSPSTASVLVPLSSCLTRVRRGLAVCEATVGYATEPTGDQRGKNGMADTGLPVGLRSCRAISHRRRIQTGQIPNWGGWGRAWRPKREGFALVWEDAIVVRRA